MSSQCVDGDCVNGFGKIIYEGNNSYEGYFKDGVKNGQGTLIEYTDGDDAMTIADGGGVTFAQAATFPTGTTAGNLTLANGSITDSGGSISFGDENISTGGTLASGAQTVAGNVTASGIVSAEQLTTTDDLTVTDVATIDGTMTISSGSITDSGGAIDFGNENISTTGTLSSGAATLATCSL